jgi:hypothetical protein
MKIEDNQLREANHGNCFLQASRGATINTKSSSCLTGDAHEVNAWCP